MKKLRPYQLEAVRKVQEAARTHRRVLLQAPTGSGKTVMGAALVADLPGRPRVLWIAHRFELLTQARASLAESTGEPVGIISGRLTEAPDARIVVAMIDTMRRKFAHGFGCVVIDEAHRTQASGYQRTLAQLPNAAVIGLTATPERLDGKGLCDTYGALILGPSQRELAAQGFLARPDTWTVPGSKVRESLAKVAIQAGDYNKAQLSRAMTHDDLIKEVVTHAAKRAPKCKTIVFASSREHGRRLARAFSESGRKSDYVDSQTPPEDRDAATRDLRGGDLEVLVNVDVLTEGFDAPEVTCVVMARPTRSLVRYLQYAGRAARPYGESPAIILDHAANWWTHGEVDADREWSLDGRPKRECSMARSKVCRECGHTMSISTSECPGCGVSMAAADRERLLDEEAVELTKASEENQRMKAIVNRVNPKVAVSLDVDDHWIRSLAQEMSH